MTNRMTNRMRQELEDGEGGRRAGYRRNGVNKVGGPCQRKLFVKFLIGLTV